MPYESLRPYLDRLTQQGLMRWIDKEVDKDWEISAIGRMIFRGMAEERRYGFGFRNIRGYPGGRVVSGVVAASTKMMRHFGQTAETASISSVSSACQFPFSGGSPDVCPCSFTMRKQRVAVVHAGKPAALR